METTHYSKVVVLTPQDNSRLLNLCGNCDEHIHLIEDRLEVDIKQRGYMFSISGQPDDVQKACDTITELYQEARENSALAPQKIHLYLQATKKKRAVINEPRATLNDQDLRMDIRIKNGVITARGENQVRYIRNIMNNDINFGIGPAGTGKTYLAVACAVHALETERVSRIILVRPIVEAGEKLGFLPGDLAQKVHPYLRPLYDALYEMLGFDTVGQLIERHIIELAPLAYMRGRSLNDAFIILDEGQNTTVEQMKMFLTRIGFNSKTVITGDITQIDLANRSDSGLMHASKVLKNINGISFAEFQPNDIVRHPIVQRIIEAYESHDKKTGK